MRELYLHCLAVLIVSENRYFNTAERIQIVTMNKYKRLNNNNLKSTYNIKYLIIWYYYQTPYELIVLIYSLPHAREVTRNLAR